MGFLSFIIFVLCVLSVFCSIEYDWQALLIG